jgi:3-methylfumaryl-CoA hydratase
MMGTEALSTDTCSIDAATLAHLQTWVGKTEVLQDHITAAPVSGLSATLDRDDAPPAPGTPLPPLWHWLYFLPQHKQSLLGADGHAQRGGFLPPVPLPRRMWAGGRLQWQASNPLVVGDAVERVSRIVSVTHKAGRTGDLVFVLVKHEVHNANGLALSEEHDIVYRANAAPTLGTDVSSLPPKGALAPRGGPSALDPFLLNEAAWSMHITPEDVLLFRYSALTFNGHRIHYDRRYVTQVEGYPGLIVHGPLIATMLIDLLRRNMPDAQVTGFEFRAVRPVFDIAPFKVHGKPSADGKTVQLWTEDHEGWLTMQATATLMNAP